MGTVKKWFIVFVAGVLAYCSSMATVSAKEDTPKDIVKEELPPGTAVYGPTFWDRMMMIAEFDAYYTLSREGGRGTINGGSADAVIAPVYKLTDRSFFILMYDGHYYNKRDFYSDDIGPRERSQFQAHNIQPMYRIDFGERARYSITPSIFYTLTYNKDIDADDWDDGLYNYRDFGGSLEFDAREMGGVEGTLSFTVQYYRRRYPNYASLLSLTGLDLKDPDTNTSLINVEKNEKDYHGILFKAGYRWERPVGFSFETVYSVLFKDLDDKRVVDSDGILSSEKQEDYLQNLELDFWHTLDTGGGLTLGVDVLLGLNKSNQNFYDGRQTLTIIDDEFTHDYYDYRIYGFRPNISYTFAYVPVTFKASYIYRQTRYTDRKAQFKNGDYKTEKQRDTEHNIDMSLQYDLNQHWSIIADWEHISVSSNNEDERVYKYSYTVNNYSLGVTFKY